jgi:hypothetical protein
VSRDGSFSLAGLLQATLADKAKIVSISASHQVTKTKIEWK